MFRRLTTAVVATVLTGACCAMAQQPAAQSDYTKSQLSLLRQDSVGRGYDVESVNRMSMNSARLNVRNAANQSVVGSTTAIPTPGATSFSRSAATFNSFGGGSTSSKPFSTASRGPVVSPYLNLFREDFGDGSGGDNYNTLVRPMLQQQQINQSLQLETQAIDRRVRSISAKPAFNPQGSQTQSPTGHPTGFMYYSHYYPALMQPQRRGR